MFAFWSLLDLSGVELIPFKYVLQAAFTQTAQIIRHIGKLVRIH